MLKSILVLVFVLFFGSIFSETLTFQTSTGKSTGISRLEIDAVSDGYDIKSDSDNAGNLEGYTDSRFGQTNWFFKKDKDNTDIYAERINNELNIKGVYKGKKFEKTYKLDKIIWTEFWGLSLEPFARSNEKEFYFWSINPGDINMIMKFKAVKLGEEKIDVKGEKIDSIHIKVTLTGLMEAFFTGNYWCRKTDGRTVLEELPQGPGGLLTRLN